MTAMWDTRQQPATRYGFNHDAARALWGEVLVGAIQDAQGRYSGGTHGMRQMTQRQADAWLRNAGPDFRHVCQLAGVDPDFISDAYKAGRLTRDQLKEARA